MALFTALCHYPVYDKNHRVICSQITPLDLHDLARLSITYGVEACFIVNPLEDQLKIAKELVEHWISGYGATYNPLRKLAFERIRMASSLEEVEEEIMKEKAKAPLWISTDASPKGRIISYDQVRYLINAENVLLIFGTAWGLHEEVIRNSYGLLEPIYGVGDYNHLSVRTAAAIILDRLVKRKDRGG